MKQNKITVLAYANQFQEMFLSKDIFLIPYYIAKELGGECKYLYTNNLGNTEIPREHRGVEIIKPRIAISGKYSCKKLFLILKI